MVRQRRGEREREGGNAERQCGEMTTAVQEYTETGTNIKTVHRSPRSKSDLQMHLGIQHQMEETLENDCE